MREHCSTSQISALSSLMVLDADQVQIQYRLQAHVRDILLFIGLVQYPLHS